MAGYITRGQEKSVVLSASQVDALVKGGNGDAALLYLLLQRMDGPVAVETLAEKLGWSQLRLGAAETALQDMGFLRRSQPRPAPADERRAYSTGELADLLETDSGFRMLVPQTEEKLGKKLKTADLQILAGLYDDLGLPVDVIYLLVCHCVERAQRRFGPGRRPTLRQIEKEGAYWARLGLMDQDSAGRYLRDYANKQEKTAAYMQALQLGGRPPVESPAGHGYPAAGGLGNGPAGGPGRPAGPGPDRLPGPVSAGSGGPGPVFPDGFLSRGMPPVLAHAAGDACGGTRQRFLNLGGGRCGLGGRPLRKGKEPARGCGQKKTTRRRVVFFRIRERGRAYSLGWSSSGRLAVSCWPCSRLR